VDRVKGAYTGKLGGGKNSGRKEKIVGSLMEEPRGGDREGHLTGKKKKKKVRKKKTGTKGQTCSKQVQTDEDPIRVVQQEDEMGRNLQKGGEKRETDRRGGGSGNPRGSGRRRTRNFKKRFGGGGKKKKKTENLPTPVGGEIGPGTNERFKREGL